MFSKSLNDALTDIAIEYLRVEHRELLYTVIEPVRLTFEEFVAAPKAKMQSTFDANPQTVEIQRFQIQRSTYNQGVVFLKGGILVDTIIKGVRAKVSKDYDLKLYGDLDYGVYVNAFNPLQYDTDALLKKLRVISKPLSEVIRSNATRFVDQLCEVNKLDSRFKLKSSYDLGVYNFVDRRYKLECSDLVISSKWIKPSLFLYRMYYKISPINPDNAVDNFALKILLYDLSISVDFRTGPEVSAISYHNDNLSSVRIVCKRIEGIYMLVEDQEGALITSIYCGNKLAKRIHRVKMLNHILRRKTPLIKKLKEMRRVPPSIEELLPQRAQLCYQMRKVFRNDSFTKAYAYQDTHTINLLIKQWHAQKLVPIIDEVLKVLSV